VTEAGFTEYAVGPENEEVTVICRVVVATTMSTLFNVLFAFAASTVWTRGALQAEILALRQPQAVL
jgi:hypothetical protein